MTISLIACVDKNGSLGYKNKLLAHIPNDLRRFKKLTKGKICVQGRKTYESIIELNGKPLPERTNIVLTNNKKYETGQGVFVYNSVEEILREQDNYNFNSQELMIIGGEEVYRQFLPHADNIYLTKVYHDFAFTDTHFPEISREEWKVTSYESVNNDEKSQYKYSFINYEKRVDNN